MHNKHIVFFLMSIMGFVTTSFAKTGALFTTALSGSTLTITPTANHFYPSMGIRLNSTHTVGNCTPNSNGFCIFSASKKTPKQLSVSGVYNLEGIVCLNGPAQYSCQTLNIPPTPCITSGGTCGVFVSSSGQDGNIGGIAGGNTICQNLANNAGLGGTWQAWLSTATVDARDNINYNATISYVRAVSRASVAPPGTLLLGNLPAAILEDEFGDAATANAFTGTDDDGTRFGTNDCNGWTDNTGAFQGRVGFSNIGGAFWTSALDNACFLGSRTIYCFESPV